MCGIFAYAGKNNAKRTVFRGLKNLDYRGHDSWGIAILSGGNINSFKRVGKIDLTENDVKIPTGKIGIGHTRWATHGAVTKTNAHPHFSSDKSFILVHNGIVENFLKLKKSLLAKGYKFKSQTDTEIIVRLIESKRKNGDLLRATIDAFKLLDGRNTIAILSNKGEIIAARNGSPLVVGISSDNGEFFFSSDVLSFSERARRMIIMDNGDLVYFKEGKLTAYDLKSGKEKRKKIEPIALGPQKVDKEGFENFMIKEIFDSPYVIRQILTGDRNALEILAGAVKHSRRVLTIGSGTAGIAASQIAYYLREFGGIAATSLIGAEAQSFLRLLGPEDLVIAVSQSGETADVLEVLEKVKERKVKIASFVNMPGSMITRMSEYKFMANAGPEIAVLSTKVFVSQLSWGYLLSKTVSGKYQEGTGNLKILMDGIDSLLKDDKFHKKLKHLAAKLIGKDHIFLLGKSQNLQIVQEGMVKIIEGTYKHAHAVPAGDLKHYAITIMDKGIPVIFSMSDDSAWNDVLNAVNEVKARGAEIIAISPKYYEKFDDWLYLPDLGEVDAIAHIIPFQLLSYYMSLRLGHDVDKPRNIAKSVTVK